MERKNTLLFRQVIELLAPTQCLDCGSDGALICDDCLPKVSSKRRGTCYRCNRLSDDGKTCLTCRSSSSLRGVTVGAYYDGVIKELILKLKFAQSRSGADLGARIILAQPLPIDEIDIVTAVPVSPARYRERGYNQAELIAKAIAKRIGRPYRHTLVRYSSDHQLGRGRKERLTSVGGVFEPYRQLHNERVLLVDDVITTGATLNESARVLRAAGAASVWGAVIGRH